MTLAARILKRIAPLGYQDSALGFVLGEPVSEIHLPSPRAQQRPDVMSDGLGQGGGVNHGPTLTSNLDQDHA